MAQPLNALRLALKDLGAPYVHEISFMDRSCRRAERFVKAESAADFIKRAAVEGLKEQLNPAIRKRAFKVIAARQGTAVPTPPAKPRQSGGATAYKR